VDTWAINQLEGGVRQVDLSQQYGYSKSSISEIINVYQRLKDGKFDISNFSNFEMVIFARVECDAFRYALATPSNKLPVHCRHCEGN
jgi:hypothetical protein